MKNIEAAKELLEMYKSITLEELENRFKAEPYLDGKRILLKMTNFSSVYCIICVAANRICSNCLYSFRKENEWHIPCMDIIYKEMERATSAEELFNAIQKRISYLTHVIEWYETMDKEYSSIYYQ
jgi:hypothetical protein